MSNSHQIGLIIRACRESRGISQDYMADMLDLVQSAYANIESGKTTLSIDRLLRITKILELDIHQVIEESITTHHVQNQSVLPLPTTTKMLLPETKEAYDLLIIELRSEIDFLRNLIRKDRLIPED